MKRTLFAVALLVCAGAPASAQTSLGAGVVFTDLDPFGLGFQVNAYVGLPTVLPALRIGGDFTYYLPEEQSGTVFGETFEADLKLWELNGNAQYHFLAEPTVSVYGLGGVNVSRLSVSVSPGLFDAESGSDTKVGANLGAGVQIPVGFGSLYGEGKYVIASDDASRFVFGAGVRIGR